MNTKKKINSLKGIWLLAFLLLLLLLVTIALLASIYKGITAGDHNVIGLFPNDAVEALATDVTRVPAKLEPDMDAYDKNSKWKTHTDVDLFEKSYTGDNGEITVESADGDKVIAPGTGNDYQFSLKNTGNVSLDYTLKLEGVFELKNMKIPFQVRLSKGSDWIVGSETRWESIDKLNSIVEKDTLGVGKYVTYTLEWQWPFESDENEKKLLQDINDTMLGNKATSTDANFRLTIKTISQVTPGAVATDENNNPIYDEVISHRTITYIGKPLLLALLLLGLILLLLWRRRIYVTGFAADMSGSTMKWRRREDAIRTDGRFVFLRMPPGKHTFTLCSGEETRAELKWVLKRRSKINGTKVDGIQFAFKDDTMTVIAARNIRAIELYLDTSDQTMRILTEDWAAIDRKHNVYTPMGKTKPDDNNYNITPGGLFIDKHHKLDFNQ
ncbi:MAG: hypothetical protein Q4F24_01280 [Eubacteriales bacterium]|nr:hypothetical protein [Eubacteriales bacterium]